MKAIDNVMKHAETQRENRFLLEVPEWGDENGALQIYVTPMTLKQQSEMLTVTQKKGALYAAAHFIAMKAQDEMGNKLFHGETMKLYNADGNVLQRVFNDMLDLANSVLPLSDDGTIDIKTLKKN